MPIARILREKSLHRVTIHPGEYHVARQEMIISTLLGSCVSVCLFDPKSCISGMNHFLLATRKYTKTDPVIISNAGRYGIHAMELLINDMLRQGAERSRLSAKAFGGASMMQVAPAGDNFPIIGEVNARFIREFLKSERIPLVASDLGGKIGRVIHLHCGDFSVYMKRMGDKAEHRVEQEERGYWEHCIEEHEHEKPQADFW
jgi:chemotaxis protein CheD|tara:strand:- start:680 stop:1285 length:606 start_codon:yes stop_codon:yes gene_type:complete